MKTKTVSTLMTVLALACTAPVASSLGWPDNYGGVMLQGFYWDSYSDTKWTQLADEAAEMAGTFDLLWIPNAGNCGNGNQMGYEPWYWFTNYNSTFGTKNELLSMVSTMNSHNIGVIGDVVINHRHSMTNWTDFPDEVYNNVHYHLTASDICSDDDSGATANHLQSGESLSSNADTGEDWNGMRDLDHMSTNVQNAVKAYLNMLLNDFGYVGFRYDMTSGYSPAYTALYNTAAQPTYSVGETWKSSDNIKSWIDGTAVNGTPTSAAFDFQFRITVRDAVVNQDWRKLDEEVSVTSNGNRGGYPLVSSNYDSGNYRRWAVTFVENHDTQTRSNNAKDPIVRDTVAANAYMLAMPGTPCVFYQHWRDYKNDINNMIAVRKLAGITNTSSLPASNATASTQNYYMARVTGSAMTLRAVMGTGYTLPSNSSDKLIAEGYHWKYYVGLTSNLNKAWLTKTSGTYSKAFDVSAVLLNRSATMTQGGNTFNVTLVYTTDGTDPTTASTEIADGGVIHVDQNMTIKVALKRTNASTNVSQIINDSQVTREYRIVAPEPEPEPVAEKTITVYLKDPGWSTVYCKIFSASDGNNDSNYGVDITANTKVINGATFYYREFESTDANYHFDMLFNDGSWGNDHQTNNISNVSEDVYYEITGGGGSSRLSLTDVTEQYNFQPEWLIGITGAGVFGGWNPKSPLLFTPHSDGTYTLSISGATMIQFKLSRIPSSSSFDTASGTNDWSIFNDGCLRTDNLVVGDNVLNQSSTTNMNFPVAGDVTLTVSNVTENSCTLNITVDSESEVEPEFYLAGDVNSWSGNNTEYKFTNQGNGVFTLVKSLSGNFKIVDESENWWNADGGAVTLTSDNNSVTLVTGGGENDNINLDANSEYTFTITVSGSTKTLTVTGFPTGDTPAHTYELRGTCNGWSGGSDLFTYQGNGVYTLTKAFSGQFKIVQDANTWWSTSSATTITASTGPIELSQGGSGNNMTLTEENAYTLTITESDNTKTLTVTGFPGGDTPTHTYELRGTCNGWSGGSDLFTYQGNGVYTLTKTFNGEFKVVQDGSAWLGAGYYHTFNYALNSVSLTTEGGENSNLNLSSEREYTLTITGGNGDSPVLTVSNLPQLQQAYYLIGGFNSWGAEVPFVENNGVFTLTQTLVGEFLVKDQYGQYLGGATDNALYTLDLTSHSVELVTDAQGKKNLNIADEAEYTFTIENGVLTVSGWSGEVSLTALLSGASGLYSVSDDMVIVEAIPASNIYFATNGYKWLPISSTTTLSAGQKICNAVGEFNGSSTAPQLTLVSSQPSTSDIIYTVVTYFMGNNFDNVPQVWEDMPAAGQVIEVVGYYYVEDGVPTLRGYGDNSSTKGRSLRLLTDYSGSLDYEAGSYVHLKIAVQLAEAWSGARRRISAADEEAYTNLLGQVLGEITVYTGVEDIAVEARPVKVRYYNAAGAVSDNPFDGLNIVVTIWDNGTTTAVKVLE